MDLKKFKQQFIDDQINIEGVVPFNLRCDGCRVYLEQVTYKKRKEEYIFLHCSECDYDPEIDSYLESWRSPVIEISNEKHKNQSFPKDKFIH